MRRNKRVVLIFVVMLGLLTACGRANITNKDVSKDKVEVSAEPTERNQPQKEEVDTKTAEPQKEEVVTKTVEPQKEEVDKKTTEPKSEVKGENLDKIFAKTYIEVIKNYKTANQNALFDLIDFNGDDIPELVADVEYSIVSMYTYKKGKLISIIDNWSYGAFGNVGYEYLPGKSLMRNYNSDHAGLTMNLYYMTLDKNYKMVDKYKGGLVMEFWKDKNKNSMPDEGEELSDPLYYCGDKEISEKKYDSYQIDGDFMYLTGKKTYDEIIKQLNK